MPTVIGATKQAFDEAELARRGYKKDPDEEHKEALDKIIRPFKEKGVTVDVNPGRKGAPIEVNRLIVPHDERSQGTGSAVMEALTKHADEHQKTIALTPSKDFGASSVGRLKEFYKRHGFVENKGRKRDFAISHSMYREPQEH